MLSSFRRESLQYIATVYNIPNTGTFGRELLCSIDAVCIVVPGKQLATKLLFSAVQSGSVDCLRIYLTWVSSFLDDHAHIDMALNGHAQVSLVSSPRGCGRACGPGL